MGSVMLHDCPLVQALTRSILENPLLVPKYLDRSPFPNILILFIKYARRAICVDAGNKRNAWNMSVRSTVDQGCGIWTPLLRYNQKGHSQIAIFPINTKVDKRINPERSTATLQLTINLVDCVFFGAAIGTQAPSLGPCEPVATIPEAQELHR